jgi:ABC-type iron transport system FetAB ATPase subunit
VIDLSSSWISIGKSTAGIEIVTERERAEDLIDELHHDMWRRRKTMELISVDASSEISAAPFLLIINDREPLLRSESSDDELSLNALASKRNIEECIYNLARSQDIGIYVIARDPDSRTKKEIGVSPDEALQCLGLLHE